MTKLTFVSNVTNPERAFTCVPEFRDFEVKFFTMEDSDETIIANAPDTQYLVVDAMAEISDTLISSMPQLKLIHSEGVGYQGIDIESAKRNGIVVCNNKGINDTAVAEGAVMLILACLKNLTSGQKAVFEGRQMEVKIASFGVVRELSECTVGLIGFGDIARATAKMLRAFGCRIVYWNRTRYGELEGELGVEYMPLDKLLAISDFVSLHLKTCEDTKNFVSCEFLSKMKKTAYLINTARGDLVDNEALLNALLSGEIAGAGLDVIYPEPVEADNILLDERIKDKLVLTPHISGITSLTIKKLYRHIYQNVMNHMNNKQINNVII